MLAGSLTEFSLPDVFGLLATTRKTGVLHVSHDDVQGRIWISQGDIAFAVADVTRAPLAARLVHSGELDVDAVADVVRAHAREDEGSGDVGSGDVAAALADAGIAADRAAELIRDQVTDAVVELARWAAGQFSFDAGAEVAPTATGLATTEVLDAVRDRLATWEQLAAEVPADDQVLVAVCRPPLAASGTIELDAEQWRILTLVDGTRTVADLVRLSGQSRLVVAQRLAEMVADGLIAPTDEDGTDASAAHREAALAALEHDLLGAPAPDDAPTSPAPASPAPSRRAAVAAALEGEGVEEPAVDDEVDVEAVVAVDDGDVEDADDADDVEGADGGADAVVPRWGPPGSPLAAARAETSADGTDAPPTVSSDLLTRLIEGVRGG
ncbi:DUF4388 domain-containing protein [Euzebya sp.]|uniref:DUF4388 domain-containing protein n=1 Tax=Euzebya sp. TaxID=1971409 RepID=UPI0035123757